MYKCCFLACFCARHRARCAYSSGNGYIPNKMNLKTQGGISGRFWGVTNPKVWEAVKRLHRLAPNLVHVCGFVWEWTKAKYNSPLDICGGGGVRGSQIQKSGEYSNGCTDWHHICRFIWEWIYAKQIAPRDTRGHLGGGGGFRGLNNQWSGKAVKRLDRLAPTLVHICGFIWEWV